MNSYKITRNGILELFHLASFLRYLHLCDMEKSNHRRHEVFTHFRKSGIDDLQPIPWDSEDKGLVAMLLPQTKEVNDILLFKFHQHGRRDVACK